MEFKSVALYKGDKLNARADNGSLTVYITKGCAVYKGTVSNYGTNPVLSGASLFAYCNEAAGLSNGKTLQRRGTDVKIL